ncbi:MAG: glutathione S-transferase family protein [Alphaproteobacteria bacterium]|nr:glutathione S-transferase family protein [Alphaproteobacteria bacterium]MCL2505452.1 glutathione S-transferase family protein [Alphaproteobacteria bacterium]
MTYHIYHYPLDGASRLVRLALGERGVPFALIAQEPWSPDSVLLSLNPAGELPVLVMEDEKERIVLCGVYSICEYLEETHIGSLLGKNPKDRAETRRLLDWFLHKMRREVTALLIKEKIEKRFTNKASPDSTILCAASANIRGHMQYIDWLIKRHGRLSGAELSLADLAAVAELSVIDYLGHVPWEGFEAVKDWYVRIKSRLSFRPLLNDRINGVAPAKNYANLDF